MYDLMDLTETKVCIRALLSSTSVTYNLKSFLIDFKDTSGCNLPLFGFKNPLEFLRSIPDTVQLYGDSKNPELYLVKSEKSAHIISLVDRQKVQSKSFTQKRLIIHPASEPRDMKINLVNQKNYISSCQSSKFKKSSVPKQRREVIPRFRSRNYKSDSSDSSLWKKEECFNTQNYHLCVQKNLKNESLHPLNQDEFKKNFLYYMKKNPKGCSVNELKNNFLRNVTSSPDRELKTMLKDFSDIVIDNGWVYHKRNYDVDGRNFCKEYSKSSNNGESGGACFDELSEEPWSSDNDDLQDCHTLSSSSPSLSTSTSYVNDGIKYKLKQLIKKFPKGLWCCDLPNLFLQNYNYELDYREFGYTSLIQMCSGLQDIFRCIRPGNEDWLLFDASFPPSSEEKRILNLALNSDIAEKIKKNLHSLLVFFCNATSSPGIDIDEILTLYENVFGGPPEYESLGFKNFKSLLKTFDGTFLNLSKINNKLMVTPVQKNSISSPMKRKEALPPITPDSDIIMELFPKDVVGPRENFIELDLNRHIGCGRILEVSAAEVWSPSKFYLQLNKFKDHLVRFMDDLQKFYDMYMNKYKMPEVTIREGQICVALYNAYPEYPEEWHRAQIINVINEKMVLLNLVDFGTVTRLKKNQIRFLHRSFHSFPMQALQANLSGVVPATNENKWPLHASQRFLELLRVPFLEANIVEINYEKPSICVILHDPSGKDLRSVNRILLDENLAKLKEDTVPAEEPVKPKMKSSLLFKDSNDMNCKESKLEIKDEFVDIEDLDDIKSWKHVKNLRSSNHTYKGEEDNNTGCASKNPISVDYQFDDFDSFDDFNNTSINGEENEIKNNEEIGQSSVFVADETSLNSFHPSKTQNYDQKAQKSCLISTMTQTTINNEDENEITSSVSSFATDSDSKTSFKSKDKCPPGFGSNNLPPKADSNNVFSLDELLRFQQQQDSKKTCELALQLLLYNPNIKEVALFNPQLALRIATQMAEIIVFSINSFARPLNYTNGVNQMQNGILNILLGGTFSSSVKTFNPNLYQNLMNSFGTSDVDQNGENNIKNEKLPEEVENKTVTSRSSEVSISPEISGLLEKPLDSIETVLPSVDELSALVDKAKVAVEKFSACVNDTSDLVPKPSASLSSLEKSTVCVQKSYTSVKPQESSPVEKASDSTRKSSNSIIPRKPSSVENCSDSEQNSSNFVKDSAPTSDLSVSVKTSSPEHPSSVVNPSDSKPKLKFIKKKSIENKDLHVINISNELFVLVAELLRSFSVWNKNNSMVKSKKKKKKDTDYMVITKKDQSLLKEIKMFTGRSAKENEVYLLPLKKVLPFLKSLGCNIKPYEAALTELEKSFDDGET